MNFPEKLNDIQTRLSQKRWDGWLLYDFRKQNSLAIDFLEIPDSIILTRRFYYWIPQKGEPIKVVHAIEEKNLDHLPGGKRVYRTWQELEKTLCGLLQNQRKILMEYSPNNAIPYLSKVDGGTLEFIRSLGVEVISSGNLIQRYASVWDKAKYLAHVEAANVLSDTVDEIWQWISSRLASRESLNEYQVQQRILQAIISKGCIVEEAPIVAVNANSADPHYLPDSEHFSMIKENDFLLIDLSCKKNISQAPFADITRVAVAASKPSEKQEKIFGIVKKAQGRRFKLCERKLFKREEYPRLGSRSSVPPGDRVSWVWRIFYS